MRALFTITIFTGAALLFLVQPLVGKELLPFLGGTPAVWNTCLVFFQVLLLAGYAYAHLLTRLGSPRGELLIHGVLVALACLLLPVGLADGVVPPVAGSPILWLLKVLLPAVGLPFFVLSTSAPLLQRWFAGTDDPAGRDPYFLYAASNTGSLLALLAFPLLLEPALTTAGQETVASAGFGVFALLTLASGASMLRRARPLAAAPTAGDPPAARDYLKWALLAFVPSCLMLGVTQHITIDVAPVPLLWVVPLAIYLLTFILAFARRTLISVRFASWILMPLAILVLGAFGFQHVLPVEANVSIHLLFLFAGAVVCHGRLAALRPHPRFLTGFYLAISVGGALGGVCCALVAPLLFDFIVEYPFAILLAFLLRDRALLGDASLPRVRVVNLFFDGVALLLALLTVPQAAASFLQDEELVRVDRTFFGVHRVTRDKARDWLTYYHGTTPHGLQDAALPERPTAYYHADTGISRLFERVKGDPRFAEVGVVGLGVGTIAALAGPGQRVTFYEIDQAVEAIARDSGLFSFIANSAAEVAPTVLGDGRLSLAAEPDGRFGLLVLDAFSSDAVPVHLLTREALDLYLGKLGPDGLLVFNCLNRHLRLTELVASLAEDRGLSALVCRGQVDRARVWRTGDRDTCWVVVGRPGGSIDGLAADPRFKTLKREGDPIVWTDDYSNLLGLVDWLWR